MKVWLHGEASRIQEATDRLEGAAICVGIPTKDDEVDLFVDLGFDEGELSADVAQSLLELDATVLLSAVKRPLGESLQGLNTGKARVAGLNCLPSFLHRDAWEVSRWGKSSEGVEEKIDESLGQLGVKSHWVEDRVGMLGPRVIFMIVNEACYTVQEGTASYSDIDQAMKLGTNYPKGPFEWANLVGVANVYESLEALYNDTNDERYRICPLLKKQYLSGQPFELAS